MDYNEAKQLIDESDKLENMLNWNLGQKVRDDKMNEKNEIAILEFEKEQIECIMLNDKPLFNPYDIGKCLGLKNTTIRDHLSEMDEEERILLTNSNVGSNNIRKLANRGELFLKEPGLYQLIFKSRKPEAQRFVKWVTKDVLPQLRKTGSYEIENKNNRLVQNLMETTEQLLGIRREEIAILQQESPNKRLSNLMIDCARNGMGTTKDLYEELFYIFACETGIEVEEIAKTKKLSRRKYLKNNPTLCETVYKFAYDHFNRTDRQVFLVPWDNNQSSLRDFR